MALDAVGLQQPMRYTIDIKSGLIQTPVHTQLMKGDKMANRVIVDVRDGKEKADLSGVTVTGGFIRPQDGAEIELEGETNESEAILPLSDACYAREGYCEIYVKLSLGGTERTILSLTGYVLGKGSGGIVVDPEVVVDIESLMTQLIAARDTANAAAERAEAAARRAENAAGGGGSGEGGGGVYFETDETLTLKDGILSVNTADVVEEDNTLPVTSAAVYETVGNINALLATI